MRLADPLGTYGLICSIFFKELLFSCSSCLVVFDISMCEASDCEHLYGLELMSTHIDGRLTMRLMCNRGSVTEEGRKVSKQWKIT
jgi:hypothetical protein